MPSIISHPAVPITLGLALGQRIISRPLLTVGIIASVLPDLDVLAFRLGIPYAHDLGHRGASHSMVFAAMLGMLALAFASHLRSSRKTAFWFVFIAGASHGFLDMLTNGGLGVAIAWPFSGERFFFPVQVIEVSPLSLRRFFSPAGAAVVISELVWVWLPCAIASLLIWVVRHRQTPSK